MAGRPPLPIGHHGKIRTKELGPKRVRAYCQYRDLDGKTRQVSATGVSIAAAERALKTALDTRSAPNSDDLTGATRFRVAAERWYATVTTAVEAGDRSPRTAAAYRLLLNKHVLPAVGELRLREATTGRIDAVLTAIKDGSGAPTAKSCRIVMSGVLGYAARHDAVTTNATRGTSPISVKPRKQPRALTVDECARWLARLAADENAVRHDLVDLVGFMLGTGVRAGEALGLAWDEVDLVGVDMLVNGAVRRTYMVKVDWTVCRVKGRPLFRKGTKTAAGSRTLRLPEFVVAMLRRRVVELYVLSTGVLPVGIVDVSSAVGHLAGTPVFPDSRGGWRDPSNTLRDLRNARGTGEFAWITSHVFRKTAATMLDEAGLTARQIADQLGQARPSLTQDVYMARGIADPRAAAALEQGLSSLFPMHKPCTDLRDKNEHLA